MQSSLLWYNLFTGTLKEEGFLLNPYDPCVSNTTIDDKQYAIAWYVNDSKISHIQSKVVDSTVNMIKSNYGNISITRGKSYVYIGIDVEFIIGGKITLHQPKHLRECIEDFGENISIPVPSAAQK